MWSLWNKKKTKKPSSAYIAYRRHREAARVSIKAAVEFYSYHYGFSVKRIAIKNQRRSWGSCSALGNLNFSYKLHFLPPCLREYVVVHELCHLRQLNHSAAFWVEVEAILPDYVWRMTMLRKLETTTGTSLASLTRFTAAHDPFCTACTHEVPSTVMKEIPPSPVVICRTSPAVAVGLVLED